MSMRSPALKDRSHGRIAVNGKRAMPVRMGEAWPELLLLFVNSVEKKEKDGSCVSQEGFQDILLYPIVIQIKTIYK